MNFAYVDTSALVKLLVDEEETDPLAELVRSTSAISSTLTIIELTAVARRREVTDGEARVAAIVAPLRIAPLSDGVLTSARTVPSRPPLKTLDLLHLATARSLRSTGTTTVIAYDHELLAAARAEGFTVLSPS